MPVRTIKLPRGTKVPDHLVVIPDGDRRWARAQGVKPQKGHKAGIENMVKMARTIRSWGIHTTTIWGLSTENWLDRPKAETEFLMRSIIHQIDIHLDEAMKEGVRFVHLGRKDRLPAKVVKKLGEAEDQTRSNKNYILNLALDYNGQDELVRAVREIVKDGVKASDIDTKLVDSYLDTSDQPYPYPDFIIRTSGEQRTSGVLAWQSQYAETYWERDNFPDFTGEKLKDAILDYSRRRRRFGGNGAEEHMDFKPELVAKLEINWWRLANIPEGTKFRQYAMQHMREQFGMSAKLAKEAAGYTIDGLVDGVGKGHYFKAASSLKKFYTLVRDELKLAFEPSLVASLRVKLLRDIAGQEEVGGAGDAEETAKKLYAEVYRISLFQAAKLGRLRVLANIEKNMAEKGMGEHHWDRAEDYLHKFYKALKERVA